jgi:hypothetical protein
MDNNKTVLGEAEPRGISKIKSKGREEAAEAEVDTITSKTTRVTMARPSKQATMLTLQNQELTKTVIMVKHLTVVVEAKEAPGAEVAEDAVALETGKKPDPPYFNTTRARKVIRVLQATRRKLFYHESR